MFSREGVGKHPIGSRTRRSNTASGSLNSAPFERILQALVRHLRSTDSGVGVRRAMYYRGNGRRAASQLSTPRGFALPPCFLRSRFIQRLSLFHFQVPFKLLFTSLQCSTLQYSTYIRVFTSSPSCAAASDASEACACSFSPASSLTCCSCAKSPTATAGENFRR